MKYAINTVLAGVCAFIFLSVPWVASAQQYPQYYHPYYPAYPVSLSCSANVSSVRAGETVTFTASGGWGGMYHWVTPERTYYNIGPVLNVALFTPGTQTVVVSVGEQTARCFVTVTTSSIYPSVPAYAPVYGYPVPSVTYQYVPLLPNTGFEPRTSAAVGFAIVFLIAAGIFVFPYVKRTLASTIR